MSHHPRDIDALRQRYLEHQHLLERLAGDAPTEALAQRYRQVSEEIETAIEKLGELEFAPGLDNALTTVGEAGPRRTAPGMKPLRTDPQTMPIAPVAPAENTRARTILILAVGVLVVAVLGFFLWRFAMGGEEPEISTVPTTTTRIAETAPPPPAKALLTVEPLTQDYGTVRRGSRATRQFELLNNSDNSLTIRAQRSQCRCLWFEYADTIPPQGSTTMTVTVDGSRAKEGPLHEAVQVVSRADPSINTTFEVVAEIR